VIDGAYVIGMARYNRWQSQNRYGAAVCQRAPVAAFVFGPLCLVRETANAFSPIRARALPLPSAVHAGVNSDARHRST
jgi:hypothetical protein